MSADAIPPESMFIALAVVTALALLAGGWYVRVAFALMPRDVAQGLEMKGFRSLARENKCTLSAVRYSFTLLGFLLLLILY